VTTIVALRGIDGGKGKATMVFVSVPDVVGMTLAQATAALSAVGLGAGEASSAAKPSGQSATGTILAQSLTAGSQAEPGQIIQLTISGY
jgi:beta-lactam-binding protein with PASTA domain